MAAKARALLLFLLVLTLPLAGCITTERGEPDILDEGTAMAGDVCSLPSQSVTQSSVSIIVNGQEREFRVSVPTSDAGTKLALIIAYHLSLIHI